ncbi:MAG: trypsin-like serine protease [Pseudomonadota bacterium]|nr:trypsin-like serine protease [Pseudomonadota bacterium]
MATSWLKRINLQMATLLCVVSLPANAIMMRHDTGYTRYLASESEYPAIFPLLEDERSKTCVATLIAARWAITAAHCIEQVGMDVKDDTLGHPVQINKQSHTVTRVHFHPHWPGQARPLISAGEVDLALLYLDSPVAEVAPIPLYQGDAEQGREMSFVGWGYAGFGSSGQRFNDGRLRRAANRVDEAAARLHFYFDDPAGPASTALPLEGIPGLGDSGGPALVLEQGEWQLAGIAVGEIDLGQRWGRYGARVVYERIGQHIDWVRQIIR